MSDDLVKRLRYLAKDIDAYESTAMSQAADRIEQLEAALREAMNDIPGWYDSARTALEGKKDE